jgi:hypothetical protein
MPLGTVAARDARVSAAHILGWMANITHGRPAEPWQHLIGLALIDLDAEQFGLSAKVANPAGAGRLSSRGAEAAETQALITRSGHYAVVAIGIASIMCTGMKTGSNSRSS